MAFFLHPGIGKKDDGPIEFPRGEHLRDVPSVTQKDHSILRVCSCQFLRAKDHSLECDIHAEKTPLGVVKREIYNHFSLMNTYFKDEFFWWEAHFFAQSLAPTSGFAFQGLAVAEGKRVMLPSDEEIHVGVDCLVQTAGKVLENVYVMEWHVMLS